MQKALDNLPVFTAGPFTEKVAPWKDLRGAPGSNRVVVEWSIALGPKVFVYPAADRAAGYHLVTDLDVARNDERWADYLEFEYVPQVVEALKAAGHIPQVICVDLRPMQTMRARRRALEAVARGRSGHGSAPTAHH
ncbi:MAG TPA: hypothetical protein VM490_04920 [Armatimonadaceae bacterium]|nr:hypothetical protein [Armatimonadaceae bacterium]